ncbi:MAG: hypothetical protein IIY58_03895 [Aeriscardovia sp.]|nr:hypothetical protein [Aeriscardovia sp.]
MIENKGILGDTMARQSIPADSVQTIITSPPYFNLKKYSEDKEHEAVEIGRGKTVDEYVSHLVKVFHNFKTGCFGLILEIPS